jgi:chloramphenicol-sensitive protein RarD
MLATNWVIFIYAIASTQGVEASLGYFINPLVSVALGRIFLRERISRPQRAAVLLAALGVVALALSMGGVPWLALVLAFSFGGYGLLRKTARANALPGSTVETLLMLPVGLGMVVGWLLATGPITALPLWWFANAARRLRLATLGFLQYLAPTGQFLLAVFVFHEPLASERLGGFGFIWFALALYSGDAYRRRGADPPSVDDESATTDQ